MKNLTLYLLLVFCTSCSKDDDISNQEVVRCKVNGNDWEAYNYRDSGPWGVGTGATDLLYYKDTRSFEFSAGRVLEDESINQGFNIYSNSVSLGFNQINYRGDVFEDRLKPTNCKRYDLDTLSTNNIYLIKIDTLNRWIEGEFEFTAIDRNCNDTVRITNGYFNLLYRF